jgi:hypothetical protein
MNKIRSVRITKKRSKNVIKNKTYSNKRCVVGGFFSSFGEKGDRLKQILRYYGVVKSSDFFHLFTHCRDSCEQIISNIFNTQKPQEEKNEHTLIMPHGGNITLFCSDKIRGIIQKLYDSIDDKDKVRLHSILKKISEQQNVFQKQIDTLTQQNVGKIQVIEIQIKKLRKELASLQLKNDDIERRKNLLESMIAEREEKKMSLSQDIETISSRIKELENSNAVADADADAASADISSKTSNPFKDFVSSVSSTIRGVPTKTEYANKLSDVTHNKNNNTINVLKKQIIDLEAKIQENTRIIDEHEIEITQKSSEASDLNALIIEKEKELNQAIADLKNLQEDLNRELANLIQQRETAFRNINISDSGDSGDSGDRGDSSITVNGGRRTIWRRCRNRSRRHTRPSQRIKSRKSRKIRRTRRKHRSGGRH